MAKRGVREPAWSRHRLRGTKPESFAADLRHALAPAALLLALALLVPLALPSPAAADESTSLPTYISTPQGWKHAEDVYLPGVTHSELGWFAGQAARGNRSECLKAQAIAARTYVLRWLNANGHSRQIPALGPSFQAWTAQFSSHSRAASQAVRGQVMTYQGNVIYSNYVSGAWPLNDSGFPHAPARYGFPASYTWQYIRDQYQARRDGSISSSTFSSRVTRHNAWAWTHILSTDNEGRSGSAVQQTLHASYTSRNRGGLGQYRSYWLDNERGYGYVRILRAFYGADVTVVGAAGGTAPAQPPSTPARTGAPDLVVTSVATLNLNGLDGALAVAQTVTFGVHVRNQGGAMTQSLPISAGVYVGGQKVATCLATVRLGAGQTGVLPHATGGWLPGNPGTFAIEARADDTRNLAEASDSNNARSIQRTVLGGFEVTASGLNVRSGPSTGSGRIGLIRSGQRYVAHARQGDWYKIDLRGGVSGWAHGGYLQRVQGAEAYQVTTGVLNVRTGPSTGYRTIGNTRSGQVFLGGGRSGNWSAIDWDGQRAWFHSQSYTRKLKL